MTLRPRRTAVAPDRVPLACGDALPCAPAMMMLPISALTVLALRSSASAPPVDMRGKGLCLTDPPHRVGAVRARDENMRRIAIRRGN